MKYPQKLSASLEDYLEAIYHIIMEKQEAKPKDIGKRLQVKGSSVTEALRLLSDRQLVNYAPYETITLTPSGTEAALDVVQRHEALRDFFIKVLGTDPGLADAGACKIEHVVPKLIIERMVMFTRFMDECPRAGLDFLENFSSFCKTGTTRSDCRDCIDGCLTEKDED